VFEALVFDGRKSAEIATEGGISVGALHKVKSRIVGRLRRFLADLE
jgi:DNA-directed RNA polymerase specialized sigma24 family protein